MLSRRGPLSLPSNTAKGWERDLTADGDIEANPGPEDVRMYDMHPRSGHIRSREPEFLDKDGECAPAPAKAQATEAQAVECGLEPLHPPSPGANEHSGVAWNGVPVSSSSLDLVMLEGQRIPLYANVSDEGARHMLQYQDALMMPLLFAPSTLPPAAAVMPDGPAPALIIAAQPMLAQPPRRKPAGRVRQCPFPGCPDSRSEKSRDALLSHLARVHVAAAQPIDEETLVWLGAQVCTTCRSIWKGQAACKSCTNRARPATGGGARAATADEAFPRRAAPDMLMPAGGSPMTGPCPEFKPSFEEIMGAQVPTMRHLPSGCRHEFADLLGQLLLRVARSTTWEAAYALICLPKLVLGTGNRRGRQHVKQVQLTVSRRLRMFAEGRVAELWAEATARLPKGTKPKTRAGEAAGEKANDLDLPASVVATIKGLVEEGALSKAAKQLISRGLADASDPAVNSKLRDLHPDGPPVVLGTAELPMQMPAGEELEQEEWEKLVKLAVSRFPPGSAAGPSGLRPSHLKECLRRSGMESCVVQGLSAFTQAAAAGSLPHFLQQILCASSLIPLNKKDGGVRPIAIGDTLRRLVGKVVLGLAEVKAQVAALRPRQCGVGVPNACEMVGMGLQRYAEAGRDSPWVALQVDVSNAFNTISRPAMLWECKAKVPAAYNWLAWSYQSPVPLFCQGAVVASSRTGVHQGDAMGPLGFSLGLEAALSSPACLEAEDALTWATWYLDDGTLVGSVEAVAAYFAVLGPALERIGLKINQRKSLLWGPGIHREGDELAEAFLALPLEHPLRSVPTCPYGPKEGITSLGVPVDAPGSHSMGAKKWAEAVDRTQEMLDKLRMLPDGQVRHSLLRYCLDACRVTHLMRSAPRAAAGSHISDLGTALRVAVADLVGCGLSGNAWEQATLPISAGGLGVTDPEAAWAEARLASLVGFHQKAHDNVGVPQEVARTLALDTEEVLAAMTRTLGTNHDPLSRWPEDPARILNADISFASQHWWACECVKVRKDRLSCKGTVRDQVRLQSQSGPVATGWLQVLPNKQLGTVLLDTEFRSLCRWWLGIPLLPEGMTLPACPLCREPLDPFGDHFVVCKSNGTTARHNALRDEWCRVLTQANIPWRKEIPTTGGDRPDDILLLGFDKGRHVSLDVTVVSPTTLGDWPLSLEAAKGRLRAAETAKTVKEAESCARMGWGHHPAAYSTWGGQGPGAQSFMVEVLKQATADLEGWPKIRRILEIRQGVSVTLMRQVARQLALRCRVLDTLEEDR